MANAAARDDDDHLIAHDVDVEPVEPNRRVLAGWRNALIVVLAVAYPAFHMAALNGLSIRDLTGIDLPFLPRLPMETWNFRIVHVAGALILGFLLFAAVRFRDGDSDAGQGPAGTARLAAAWVALAAAALALGMAVLFARQIAGGVMWNGIDETIRFRETWLFGVPLVAASLAGIVLSWVWPRARGRFALPDIVLCVAAAAVAAYLITIYGTLMRNSTGTPFAPIGISLAAVAGTLLIMELTRRMAGMALVIIAAVFLIYVFAGRFMPGFLKAPAIDWERFFSQVYTDAGILGPTTAVSRRPISSCSSSLPPSCRPRRSATISSTSPLPRRAGRAAARPRWRSLPAA
jgi:TRAP-type uncharacterized transport system fused permease subunit